MIIIWGSRTLSSRIDSGRFYCPGCERMDVGYAHKAARDWFTLYFIPIFPVGGRTEYIECTHCKGTYQTTVLDLKPPTEDDLFLRDCAERLFRGRSLETVEKDLVESGRTTEQAVELIDAMTNGKVWECEFCGAHYHKKARKCRECDDRRGVRRSGAVQL